MFAPRKRPANAASASGSTPVATPARTVIKPKMVKYTVRRPRERPCYLHQMDEWHEYKMEEAKLKKRAAERLAAEKGEAEVEHPSKRQATDKNKVEGDTSSSNTSTSTTPVKQGSLTPASTGDTPSPDAGVRGEPAVDLAAVNLRLFVFPPMPLPMPSTPTPSCS